MTVHQSIEIDGHEVVIEIPQPPAISVAYEGWPAPDAPMVEFALYYARLGWRVFPCGRKAPLTACDKDANGNKIRGTGGFYKATTDEDQIRAWWKKWPSAMIGIRAGTASGVWAIDPDGEEGLANWAAIVAKHGELPRTHQHRTPGGGHHLVFKWHADRPVKCSSGQMKDLKIDVKGQGGYFIAPPSVGKNGKRYEIADPAYFFDLAEAPDWLYELVVKKPPPTTATPVDMRPITERAMAMVRPPSNLSKMANRPYVDAVLRGEYQAVASIPSEGCQNDQLNISSVKLGHYVAGCVIDEHEAIDVMMKACADNGLLDETGRDACMATIESGMSYGKTQPKGIPERKTESVDAPIDGNVFPIHGGPVSPQPAIAPLPLTLFDDVGNYANKSWLLKGAIAKGETSMWIAPPKKLKSALMTDISICIASGTDWRGYRSKETCGVVYFAFERGDLVKRRFDAHRKRDGWTGLPIAISGKLINIMDPGCVGVLVATIRDAEKRTGHGAGFAVIDTFAKGIAAGGGDENQAKDLGRALANLRLVQEQTGVHIAIVHHTGKDEKKGARGSNAQVGDVDVLVQIAGDDVKVATVTGANDQAEGELTKFKGEKAVLNVDEDGDEVTTWIISQEDCGSADVGSNKPLKGRQLRAMNLLINAINDVGKPAPASCPPGVVKVVTIEQWKEYCQRGDLTDGGAKTTDAFRSAFNNAKTELANKMKIGIDNGLVWIAYHQTD
jgi:Bifunctional DNA primase/polymerase, N-terminal/AAA domain